MQLNILYKHKIIYLLIYIFIIYSVKFIDWRRTINITRIKYQWNKHNIFKWEYISLPNYDYGYVINMI